MKPGAPAIALLLSLAALSLCPPVAAGDPPGERLDRASAEPAAVHLYFGTPDGVYLTAEAREIAAHPEATAMGSAVVQALLAGPRGNRVALLPAGTTLRSLFVDAAGTAYVDLVPPPEGFAPGARSELLAFYAIVNTLVLNVAKIERVKILVEGGERPTLAGHVELDAPRGADMLLVR